jgi:DNA-directed RNA polymerase subunit M/transcription elongation factor TFIIS
MIGRRYAAHCPACQNGHGLWRQLAIRGKIRTLTYTCDVCSHEWALVQSAETDGYNTDAWLDECPSCENGRGIVRGVKIDRETRTRTYRCDSCRHEWIISDIPAR